MITLPLAGLAAPAMPAMPATPPQLAAPASGNPAGDNAGEAVAVFTAALAITATGKPAATDPAPLSAATPLIGPPPAPFVNATTTPASPLLAGTPPPIRDANLQPVIMPGPPELVVARPTPEHDPGLPVPELIDPELPTDPASVPDPAPSKEPGVPKHSATVLAAVSERLAAKGVNLPATAKPAIAAAAASATSADPEPSPAAPVPDDSTVARPASSGPGIGPTKSRGANRPTDSGQPTDAENEGPLIHAAALLTAPLPMLRAASPIAEPIRSPLKEVTARNAGLPQTGTKTGLLVASPTVGSEPAQAPEQSAPGDEPSVPIVDPIASPITSPAPPPPSTRLVHDHVLPAAALHALPATAASPAQALHSAPAPVPTPPPTAPPGPMSTPAPQPMAITGAFGERIGLAIAHRVAQGQDRLTVRLDPKELGRIEISLGFDEHSGALRAVVATEHSNVLEALRRDAPELTRALAAAGLPTDESSLRFDAGGDANPRGQSSSSAGHGHGQHHANWARWADAAGSGPAEAPSDASRRRPGRGRLDLYA